MQKGQHERKREEAEKTEKNDITGRSHMCPFFNRITVV